MKFYDSNGVVIGEEVQMGIELDPGDKKRYQITYRADDGPLFNYYELSVSGDTMPVEQTSQATTAQRDLVNFVSHTSYDDDNGSGVKGVIQNVSGEELAVVTVRASFLDESGVTLRERSEDIIEFPDGEKRQFKIEAQGLDTWDTYELVILVTP